MVLDASAVLELLRQSERADAIASQALAANQRLHAPQLLDIEVTQVLRRLVLHKSITATRAQSALADFALLAIERHMHTSLLGRIFELRDAMTAYDAAYVALAEALDAPLLTCAAHLARAHGHRARITLLQWARHGTALQNGDPSAVGLPAKAEIRADFALAASHFQLGYHPMVTIELDILRIVGERLEAARLPYMLTGSMALAYYATPRMTRDIDIVVALSESSLPALQVVLAEDFYVDMDAARNAVSTERLFNLMHFASAIKIDLIVRKSTEYRLLEFDRRQRVKLAGVSTWIVSREDLILSKLEWAHASGSEMQQRDITQLLASPVDWPYLNRWAAVLGVELALKALTP